MKAVTRYASIIALSIAASLTLGATAHADPAKCQLEISKVFPKFVQTKIKALQKCNDKIVKGDILGPCPDGETTLKIQKAESKMRAAVDKKCGGDDKLCGVGGDDDTLASIGWDIGNCPNIESGSCTNAISDCDDVSDCLFCVGEAAVDQAITLFYDDLNDSEFGTNSDTNKCQREIGKSATKFLVSKSKALAKCEKAVLNGDILGPCPDAITAIPAIQKAESKKRASICKKCGGDDKLCGGGDDLLTVAIGFAANCPNVTVPNGGPACAAAVGNVQGIVDCVDCVAEFKADCIDPLSVPDLKAYPTECGGGVVPCPTPTPGALCPTLLQADADGPAVDLDTGWTGLSHDAKVPTGGRLTLTVSGCAGGSPPCGVCNLSGPVANAGGTPFQNQRCIGNTATQCDDNGDCGLDGPCTFIFGPPLPLAAGGTSVCVINVINGPVTGTVDIEAGTTETSIDLISQVHLGPTIPYPCPLCGVQKCVGGANDGTLCGRDSDCPGGACSALSQCSAGPNVGLPCTINGQSATFGDVSLDCPPNPGANIGNLPIPLDYTSGTQTRTISAAQPLCRNQIAFPGARCFCDTCDNEVLTPCTSDADCALLKQCKGGTNNGTNCLDDSECPGGLCQGGLCGGRRCQGGANNGTPCGVASECPGGGCGAPGAATQPNQCDNGICNANPLDEDSVDEGTCDDTAGAGPFESFCGPKSIFAQCLSDADCLPVNSCSGGTNNNALGCNSCIGGVNNGNLCTVDSACPGGYCNNCPGGTCLVQTCAIGEQRECFTDDAGIIGGDVSVEGLPYPPCGNTGSGVVGALFCIAPTSSSAINAVSGLPGLGRVTLPTTYTFIN
jgi:hypothetical protein